MACIQPSGQQFVAGVVDGRDESVCAAGQSFSDPAQYCCGTEGISKALGFQFQLTKVGNENRAQQPLHVVKMFFPVPTVLNSLAGCCGDQA